MALNNSQFNETKTKALAALKGDMFSPAGAAFRELLEATLQLVHYQMESAVGHELLSLQGQAQLVRQWLNKIA